MKDNLSPLNLVERVAEPTPPFWKKVRRIGLLASAIGGAIVAAVSTGGLALPAVIVTTAKVVATVGGTVVAASSLTSTER